MNKFTFLLSAFLFAMFINQHILKSRDVTAAVIQQRTNTEGVR
jgi:hypothetical protein